MLFYMYFLASKSIVLTMVVLFLDICTVKLIIILNYIKFRSILLNIELIFIYTRINVGFFTRK